MEIKIKNCNNCPFKVTSYDSECIGNDTFENCNLISFFNPTYINSYIASYNSYEQPDIDECDYCNKYWLGYHEAFNAKSPEPEFDEAKCECERLRQEYIDAQPVIQFNSPEWCPLVDISELKLMLEK